MTSYHIHQVAKLTAELVSAELSATEVEAIEWALSKHKAILAKRGVFAI